jgi:hypothetical protein
MAVSKVKNPFKAGTTYTFGGNLAKNLRVASPEPSVEGSGKRQEGVINFKVMQQLGQILNVPAHLISKLEVTSSTANGLYMVNAKETPNGELNHIRGRVVDLAGKRQLARAFGHAENVTVSGLSETENGLVLNDSTGVKEVPQGKYQLHYGFEGVLLMVYPWSPKDSKEPVTTGAPSGSSKVEMMVSNHRNLYTDTAKWAGRGRPFRQYWDEYSAKAGINQDVLFGGDNAGKEVCLLFMAVVPELMMASKLPFGLMNRANGFLAFLGTVGKDAASYDCKFSMTSKLFLEPVEMNEPSVQVYHSTPLSVSEANAYLHHGFNTPLSGTESYINVIPAKFMPGESVILSEFGSNAKGEVGLLRSHRVCSAGFSWRKEVLGDESELFHRYFVNKDNDLPYTRDVPTPPSMDYLQAHAFMQTCISFIPMIDPLTNHPFTPSPNVEERMYHAMLLASPPAHYAQVLGFQAKAEEVKMKVFNWLLNLIKTKSEVQLRNEAAINIVRSISLLPVEEQTKKLVDALVLHSNQEVYRMWRECEMHEKFARRSLETPSRSL